MAEFAAGSFEERSSKPEHIPFFDKDGEIAGNFFFVTRDPSLPDTPRPYYFENGDKMIPVDRYEKTDDPEYGELMGLIDVAEQYVPERGLGSVIETKHRRDANRILAEALEIIGRNQTLIAQANMLFNEMINNTALRRRSDVEILNGYIRHGYDLWVVAKYMQGDHAYVRPSLRGVHIAARVMKFEQFGPGRMRPIIHSAHATSPFGLLPEGFELIEHWLYLEDSTPDPLFDYRMRSVELPIDDLD